MLLGGWWPRWGDMANGVTKTKDWRICCLFFDKKNMCHVGFVDVIYVYIYGFLAICYHMMFYMNRYPP